VGTPKHNKKAGIPHSHKDPGLYFS
jgi:hypothetical protein